MLSCSKNSYLCNMNNPLQQFGNIPITVSVLASIFPDIKGKSQKIRQLERDKQVIRLKKGLYVCNSDITGKALSTELMANHLYAPSYVSMSSALRYYGLIPEAVYTKQSMTLKHSRDFDTPLGRFEYTHISKKAFPIGLTSVKADDYAFVMATPEKALCDLIANSPNVNLRYMKEVETYLEEDIRFDFDYLRHLNTEIFEDYVHVGKKAESIKTLLKWLKK